MEVKTGSTGFQNKSLDTFTGIPRPIGSVDSTKEKITTRDSIVSRISSIKDKVCIVVAFAVSIFVIVDFFVTVVGLGRGKY